MSCDKQTFTTDYEQIRQRLKAQKKWQAGRVGEHDCWLYLAINLLCLRLFLLQKIRKYEEEIFSFLCTTPALSDYQ